MGLYSPLCWSNFTFGFLRSLTSLLLPNWWSELKYSPCPPARDLGSLVCFYNGVNKSDKWSTADQSMPLTEIILRKFFFRYYRAAICKCNLKCPLSVLYCLSCIERLIKQGRIHGYPSCVRVGRGSDEIDQPSSWAGAVTQKSPVNTEKS